METESEFFLLHTTPGTWLPLTATIMLPSGTDYVAIEIAAAENIFDDTTGTEFDGYYADGVTVEFSNVNFVPTIPAWGLAALALSLLLLMGVSIARRQVA